MSECRFAKPWLPSSSSPGYGGDAAAESARRRPSRVISPERGANSESRHDSLTCQRVRHGGRRGGSGCNSWARTDQHIVRQQTGNAQRVRARLMMVLSAGSARRILPLHHLLEAIQYNEGRLEGKSSRAIAMTLNSQGVPRPQGGEWRPSTIYGNPKRGTGILNKSISIYRTP